MDFFKSIYLNIISIVRVFGASLIRKIELANLKVEWAKRNLNNCTTPVKYFPIDLVTIGDHSYGPIDIYTYFTKGEGLQIGKYCSIAKDVKFILGGNHSTYNLMTFPIKNKFIDKNINESITKGKIVLEDDVWIGVGAIILSGVHIGQGCVIAAGSVVTKSFPKYSIIGGNPAKLIKMRFEENIVSMLYQFDLKIGSLNPNLIIENIDWLSCPLTEDAVRKLILLTR